MRGYRITENNQKWQFHLIPNNNNDQPIGHSPDYDTKDECIVALSKFKIWVKLNQIDSIKPGYVEIIKDELKIYFQYIDNNVIIYQSRKYNKSSGTPHCKNIIKSIYDKLDEYTTIQSNP